MIELTKKDLRQIATDRYHNRHYKKILVFLGGLIVIAVLLALFVPDSAPLSLRVLSISAAAVYYVTGTVIYVRRMERHIKTFIAEFEVDPVINYKKAEL